MQYRMCAAMTESDHLSNLQQLVGELEADEGDHRRSPLWNQTLNLLKRTEAPQKTVINVVAGRNLAALRELVDNLVSPPAPYDGPEVDPEQMRLAMRAFRERLKLVKLDHESKLGRSPLTSGKSADIDAIIAPREFPDEIWQALVRAGKLRDAGGGFYELAD